MGPRISVVTPAHNAAAYLPFAIESVRRQTVTDLEIIVIDDGSTDDTAAVAERLRQSSGARDPICVVLHREHRGPPAARNAGLRAARGRYVAFLDADDLWHPRFAERSIATLDERRDIDMTYCGFDYIDRTGARLGDVWEGTDSMLGAGDLLRFNPIHTSSAMVRKAALDRIGGFDEALRDFEDLDLWLRIALLRPRNILCIREILTGYRRHPDQITANWQRMAESWEIFFAKWRHAYPDVVSPIGREADARSRLHIAQAAYKAAEYDAARRLTLEAWRRGAAKLIRDSAVWKTTMQYVLLSLLPDAVHDRMVMAARTARARRATARAGGGDLWRRSGGSLPSVGE